MAKAKKGVALKMEGDTEVDVYNLDGNEDVYVTWFWRVADNLVVDETEIAVFRVGEQSDSTVCGVLKSTAVVSARRTTSSVVRFFVFVRFPSVCLGCPAATGLAAVR